MSGADWPALFGRLHPVLVHLPIGMLAAVVVVGLLGRGRQGTRGVWRGLLWITALSATAAAGAGWVLARDGGYDGRTLFWHRWTGVGVAAALLLAAVVACVPEGGKRRALRAIPLLCALLLVMIAGHLGGSLTHGADYLTRYAPAWLGGGAGVPHAPALDGEGLTSDATMVLAMVRDSCVECHGAGKRKGDLRLDTPEGIASALVAGDPARSELFRRVALAPGDADRMPPDGEAIADETVLALARWIRDGASLRAIGAELEGDAAEMARAAQRIEALRLATGAVVSVYPGVDGDVLEVDYSLGDGAVTAREISALADAGASLYELNLSGREITPEALGALPRLPGLERLHLERTDTDDASLGRWLDGAPGLRYLNLHSTRVTDASLDRLASCASLERLVVFNTAVSAEALAALRAARPELRITAELTLPPTDPSPG